MSCKARIVKAAIAMTPDFMVRLVANRLLKHIAKISDLSFDLGSRTAFARFTLAGESEQVEVSLSGFAISSDDGAYQFILGEAVSNRLWVHNVINKFAGKRWKIPQLPRFQAHIALLADVLDDSVV